VLEKIEMAVKAAREPGPLMAYRTFRLHSEIDEKTSPLSLAKKVSVRLP
jgi:hypothetical protein